MDAVVVPKGARRSQKEQIWESHKDEFYSVYKVEDKTLEEAMDIMESKYNIKAW